jgi:hypothetical protein
MLKSGFGLNLCAFAALREICYVFMVCRAAGHGGLRVAFADQGNHTP